jgi:hypothetical protein
VLKNYLVGEENSEMGADAIPIVEEDEDKDGFSTD